MRHDRDTRRMLFPKGTPIIWEPSTRAAKKYGPGPHIALYLYGQSFPRGSSTITLESRAAIRVLNSQIRRNGI